MNDLGLILPEPFKDWSLLCFIEHWAGVYDKKYEHAKHEFRYDENINPLLTDEHPLTDKNLTELYIWKNGMNLSADKKKSVERNYQKYLPEYSSCPPTHEHLEHKYLEYKKEKERNGGAIWGIFYLHILSKNKPFNENLLYEYPIFDQHVYRAMLSMELETPADSPAELPVPNTIKDTNSIFYEYKRYRCFYKCIENNVQEKLDDGDPYKRKIDKALLAFGKSLKKTGQSSKCCT